MRGRAPSAFGDAVGGGADGSAQPVEAVPKEHVTFTPRGSRSAFAADAAPCSRTSSGGLPTVATREARDRDRAAGASEPRARGALPGRRARALDDARPGPRRRDRPRRDLPRHDREDGALREGALRDRRLRPLRRADRAGDHRGRADGRGRRRQDLRPPRRAGDPHPHRRARHRGRHAASDAARSYRIATIDTGDTAWMLTATALVLLMTPALGPLLRRARALEEHAQHVHDEHRRARAP